MAKVNLSAQVEETVRNRILNLEYPHNHILVEEVLCTEFGVSRSPVREALRMLEASGMIHKMSNRSYVVRQVTLTDVKELYELRFALERYVVEQLSRAAADDDALVRLLVYWQNLNLEEEPDPAKADREFHETLASVYGNKTIAKELHDINEHIRVFRVMDFHKPHRFATTRQQHIDLLKAIHAKDAKSAAKHLEININEGMENALDALRQAILRAYGRE
ncbi:MAG: GntR family transcriptional regulator [Methylobacteriaceae bacterium]|jgi:DNA-binding GntR family transcriptional regulator|nr:GntR family transcriptional regulator [Methylobacteriaceae bacterium]